ncbi:MAG: Gfo/Idh/MocA family oxidoreductase [Aureispira sp.]|nr:Gfo/Idh/MocA family oxidoreductase [Aureispira sp.]
MLKIGVLGVGHLGKIHLKCIQQIEDYELVGFYDPNDDNAQEAIKLYNTKRFDSVESLLEEVDVVDIVTPTTTHFQLAEQAIKAGKHFFVEKPITQTPEEAQVLCDLLQPTKLKAQVGHVERFNPAMLALEGITLQPKFIEVHRLATFNPRGTDVSVVLDLMIHDLDIILKLIDSEVLKVDATGVAIISDSPDIANARIQFNNGTTVNITASRISLKQMRKLRIFQPDAYISLDFLDKKTEIIRMYDHPIEGKEHLVELDTGTKKRYIEVNIPTTEPTNAIKMELELLAKAILEDIPTTVSLQDGLNALALAYQINDSITANELKHV